MPTAASEASDIKSMFDRLWPLLRSLTGDGVRRTHDLLSEILPLERMEVPSGTPVLDWIVPPEWRVREAYVEAPDGRRILDVAVNNLHLVNYAVPFRGVLSRAELDRHLHSLPDQPDAVPYVTSYYKPGWGFCLKHRERLSLPEGDYRVVIDTEHDPRGSMTLSHVVLPGETDGEVLLSSYTCHPSLANNELSGPLALAFLYRRVAAWPHRRPTYRFVLLPETIGSITYLAHHGKRLMERLDASYVMTCIGTAGPFTYKRSRRGASLADRAAEHVLRRAAPGRHTVRDFFPDGGSDERQYCSPGFNLPVGSIIRNLYATYPEYHTSLDNKSIMSFDAMVETIDLYERAIGAVDCNLRYRNLYPFGEPQLGRRGLYPGHGTSKNLTSAVMWLLNYSDGQHDLIDIAERSGHSVEDLDEAAAACAKAGLLAFAET
jgi:aminopeptidase-like protein